MITLRSLGDHGIFGPTARQRSPSATRRGPFSGAHRKRNRGRTVPLLEPLEDRQLLTSYTVTNNGDGNTGSGTSGTLR